MSLIKKIKQFINGSWQEFQLDANNIDNVATREWVTNADKTIVGDTTFNGDILFDGGEIKLTNEVILSGSEIYYDGQYVGDFHPNAPYAYANKQWVESLVTNQVKYLGIVNSVNDIINAFIPDDTVVGKAGDFVRAGSSFTIETETVHPGDIIIANNVTPSISLVNYDIIHTEDPGNYGLLEGNNVWGGSNIFTGNPGFYEDWSYYMKLTASGLRITKEHKNTDSPNPYKRNGRYYDIDSIWKGEVSSLGEITSQTSSLMFPDENGTFATREWAQEWIKNNTLMFNEEGIPDIVDHPNFMAGLYSQQDIAIFGGEFSEHDNIYALYQNDRITILNEDDLVLGDIKFPTTEYDAFELGRVRNLLVVEEASEDTAYAQYCFDSISVQNAEGYYHLYFPNEAESGTIATQEWVQAQNFGSNEAPAVYSPKETTIGSNTFTFDKNIFKHGRVYKFMIANGFNEYIDANHDILTNLTDSMDVYVDFTSYYTMGTKYVTADAIDHGSAGDSTTYIIPNCKITVNLKYDAMPSEESAKNVIPYADPTFSIVSGDSKTPIYIDPRNVKLVEVR